MKRHEELTARVVEATQKRFELLLGQLKTRAHAQGRSLTDSDRLLAATLACENRAQRRRRRSGAEPSQRPFTSRARREIKQTSDFRRIV